MAGETYSVILNGLLAFYLETDNVVNPLSAGPYHLTEEVRIASGFDPLEHTLAVITDAAEIRALNFLYSQGGYAVWKVYDAQEAFAGYLTIADSEDVVMAVAAASPPTGAYALSTPTTTDEIFFAAALAYLRTDAAMTDFTETDEIPIAITGAKAKAIPAE